jgi:hypothetical protein
LSDKAFVMDETAIRHPRQAKAPANVTADRTRIEAVLSAAESAGLLGEKNARIGGRISAALVGQAKKQTGIQKDSELIEFALANIALEDDFARMFRELRGTVDPKLQLGY